MSKPELKQIVALSLSDFRRHPVWVGVHTRDTDQPWYDETDEETFRPWTDPLPVGSDVDFLLVRASLLIRNGTTLPGFVTPASDHWNNAPRPGLPSLTERYAGSPLAVLGIIQPHIFLPDYSGSDPQWVGFWGGIVGIPVTRRQALYQAIGRGPDDIFPITFNADPGLALGLSAGRVDGFYKSKFRQVPQFEV